MLCWFELIDRSVCEGDLSVCVCVFLLYFYSYNGQFCSYRDEWKPHFSSSYFSSIFWSIWSFIWSLLVETWEGISRGSWGDHMQQRFPARLKSGTLRLHGHLRPAGSHVRTVKCRESDMNGSSLWPQLLINRRSSPPLSLRVWVCSGRPHFWIGPRYHLVR